MREQKFDVRNKIAETKKLDDDTAAALEKAIAELAIR